MASELKEKLEKLDMMAKGARALVRAVLLLNEECKRDLPKAEKCGNILAREIVSKCLDALVDLMELRLKEVQDEAERLNSSHEGDFMAVGDR